MAPGVPARTAIVCAVLVTALTSHAQPPPGTTPTDRPPLTSPTATPPAPGAPAAQPTIARVKERRQVAVIDLSTEPTAEVLATELYNVLINHPDLRPLANPNFVRSLKGPFADEERASVDVAIGAKAQAADFLVELDYRSAELAAVRGIDALHDVRPSPDVLGLYAELAFAAGQAALRQRRPNDASLLFGLSYRLDSAKRPDPARYEPDIVEAYGLAVTKIPIVAKLEVKGTGTAWIDGIDRGAPGVFEVSQGLHLVQLTGAERETRGAQVPVPQTAAIEIPAAPASEERRVERARIELAQTRDSAARAGAVRKLAALLKVGDAVLIEKGEGGMLRVQTWRDRAPGFSPLIVHNAEQPVDLLTPLAPPRAADPEPEEIIPLPPPPPEIPFYKKRWVQAVGVGVSIIAASVIYSLATQDRMIDFGGGNVTPEGE